MHLGRCAVGVLAKVKQSRIFQERREWEERILNKLARLVINDRKDSALTQKEYGDLLGISAASVVGIEKSQMLGSKVIKALAVHFNKTTKEIREMMLSKKKGA
jgi:DNA-binding XRE family transcriptional regulator